MKTANFVYIFYRSIVYVSCHLDEKPKLLDGRLIDSEWTFAGMADGTSVESTPQELLKALVAVGQKQDRKAFQRLFEYFAPRVKSFMLRRSPDTGRAEEVVQETMLNVWRKARLFKPEKASASTWIFAIARNVQIDLYRKTKRPELDPVDPAFVPKAAPLAQETIEKNQSANRLNEIVAYLPSEQQEVLQLAFFNELPHPQIAEKLGIPLGTVKSRIRLAFKRIRSDLGGVE